LSAKEQHYGFVGHVDSAGRQPSAHIMTHEQVRQQCTTHFVGIDALGHDALPILFTVNYDMIGRAYDGPIPDVQ
jgi:hypothetical protein